MLAESERDLNTARWNLGRFRWRLLKWINDEAGAIWKGRQRDSLVGVTRRGKQGNEVNVLEWMLIPPPIRATSCIQLVSQLSRRWVALPILQFSMLLESSMLVLGRRCNSFEGFNYPRLSSL